jgi:hypothetical protein
VANLHANSRNVGTDATTGRAAGAGRSLPTLADLTAELTAIRAVMNGAREARMNDEASAGWPPPRPRW